MGRKEYYQYYQFQISNNPIILFELREGEAKQRTN